VAWRGRYWRSSLLPAVTGAALAVVTTPVRDCPPLGNGGAMPVASVGADVPNGSVAVESVREYRVSLRVTTSVPEHYHVDSRGRCRFEKRWSAGGQSP